MYLQPDVNSRLTQIKEQLNIDNRDTFLIDELLQALDLSFIDMKIAFEHKWEFSTKVPEDTLSVSGLFFDDENQYYKIFICLHSSTFSINAKEWDDIAFDLSLNIQHELIHKLQNENRPEDIEQRNRNFGKENEKYLSNPDELDARAHDISLELTRTLCYNDAIVGLKSKKSISPTLQEYRITFADDPTVLRKLLKKVYIYMNSPTCVWKP